MSLMREDFASLFALRGVAFGLPDPAVDFAASLDLAAADQRRWTTTCYSVKTSLHVAFRLYCYWETLE